MCYSFNISYACQFLLSPYIDLDPTLKINLVSSISLLAHIRTIRKFCYSTIYIYIYTHTLLNQFSPSVLMKPCLNHHKLSTYYSHLPSSLAPSLLAFMQSLLTWHCHIC